MQPTASSLPHAPPVDPGRNRMSELVATASIEMSPRDTADGERLRELFTPGLTVFVNHPASVTPDDIVAACVRLRRAGFTPVPHVAARRLVSHAAADDFLRRAAGEAEITGALLIGGDPATPAGPFGDSFDLLASGIVEAHGLRWVAFAGYPEGHPHIATRTLDTALRRKIGLARRLGLDIALVTQFGFEAEPILEWIATLRGDGIRCRVEVGLAGPASVVTLTKFAVRCGIGNSLRALARGHAAFARLLTEVSPDALVAALVEGEASGPPIDGLHIFTFGGVRSTAGWLRAARG